LFKFGFSYRQPSPNIDLVKGLQVLVEVLEQNINKTCDYESKKKFQVSWVAKLPWFELQMGVDGCVHLVKCKVCSKVEHKNKLLVLKWIHSINTLVGGRSKKIWRG
jgi:hypothetical protein